MIYILFGVSGCGKSTVGKLLAEALALPFFDADDFHPEENVKKMAAGTSLDDEDRQPWLEILGQKIKQWASEGGAVLACSALKEKYRTTLGSVPVSQIYWVFLEGDKTLIDERIRARTGHYMPPSLLDSQFEALEVPEYALKVDISVAPALIVKEILENLPKS